MRAKPKLRTYDYHLKTIDSHTMGEPTRIVYDGVPELKGATMMEKKKDFMENYDFLRTALMLEPRGHRDMFGAILTEPVHEEADCGVIFMDSGGCLNMCGHGSMGVASMLVETGMVEVTEPYTEVVLDAPSGIIRTRVHVVNGEAVEVSIRNVPAFLYRRGLSVQTEKKGTVTFDLSFGGSFFALVDAEAISLSLELENIREITELGMELLDTINREYKVKHPYLNITSVDLVEFYSHTDTPGAHMKNCVIFGDEQADRSPCGTGTSAKLAALYAKGDLGLQEEFIYESITGSLFRGEVVQEVELDGRVAVIPQITGSAYITGCNEWILDRQDPLCNGFLLGEKPKYRQSVRARIVQAAWELFQEKGYLQTTVEDVIARAQVEPAVFFQYFANKEELEHTLADLFDEKYAQLMVSMNPRYSQYQKLLYLNQELFTLIEHQVPFQLVSYLYVNKSMQKQDMMNKQRLYYRLIPQIIAEGQKKGEFTTSESAEVLADTYASLERGMIYDWCIKDGKSSLAKEGRRLLPIYLSSLLTEGRLQ